MRAASLRLSMGTLSGGGADSPIACWTEGCDPGYVQASGTGLTESIGSYYADWVAKTIDVPRSGDYSPLPVYTSFDPALQRLAEEAVEKVLAKQGKARRASQAAMVVMRPDGRVLAMVGGRDHDKSQFNRAVQSLRQPGSSFKLFVYLAALRGGLTPNSTVVDRPISVGSYEPKNFGHRYRGAMRLRSAFASSINTVAVQLSEAVRRKPVIKAARDLGITTPLKARPSLALGAFEILAAATTWLAFFAPAFYRNWIAERSPSANTEKGT